MQQIVAKNDALAAETPRAVRDRMPRLGKPDPRRLGTARSLNIRESVAISWPRPGLATPRTPQTERGTDDRQRAAWLPVAIDADLLILAARPLKNGSARECPTQSNS
jgi:hypothetical protein